MTSTRDGSTNQAVDFSPITDFITDIGGQLQVLGAGILIICLVLAGVKIAVSSSAGNRGGPGGGGGLREAMGAVLGIVIGGLVIGGALIIAPLIVGAGQG